MKSRQQPTTYHLQSKYSRRAMLQMLAASSATLLLTTCSRAAPSQENVPVGPATPVPADLLPTPGASSEATGTAAIAPTEEAVATMVPNVATAAPTPWTLPTEIRVTTNEDFYTLKYNPSPPPEVDAESYRLVIEGEVNTPLSLSLADLKAFPSHTQMRTLQCISNPVGGKLIGNAVWTGLAMADLLQEAGVRPSGNYLQLESFDGYHTGITVELAMAADSLLVYEMNGEPLPVKHGYPIRALWPGRYGQKQPKWLQRITVQSQPHIGHWEGQGWSDEARIQPTSIIQQPPERELQSSAFFIAGIANTTDVGLDKVEVSIDNGDSWQTAELLRGPSPLVWTQWWIHITDLQSGVYRVLARTTDDSGRTQVRANRGTRLLNSTFPDGTNEMHQIAVQVKTEG